MTKTAPAQCATVINSAMQEAHRLQDPDANALAFIQRWAGTMASELPAAQSFVTQLCALLGVDAPHPTPD